MKKHHTSFRMEQLLKSVCKLLESQKTIVKDSQSAYDESIRYITTYEQGTYFDVKKATKICFQKKRDLDLQKKELEKLQLKKQFYEKRLSLLTNSK